MNWYPGSIQEAVVTSKRNKAYFVVYIEGSDELSVIMTEVLDRAVISQKFEANNFVAIKLVKGTEGHKQFEEFYKLVPVPSVFFIDQNGSPVEVVVADKSKDNVLKKLIDAIEKCAPESKSNDTLLKTSPSVPSTSSSTTSAASCSSMTAGSSQQISQEKMPKNIISDSNQEVNLKDNKKEDTKNVEESVTQTENSAVKEATIEERVEKAKVLIEKKKEEKIIEERRKEKEAELERRRIGHEIQLAKRDKQDLELRQLKEEREREKKEEALARQRILDQIQQDRADRAERLAMTNNTSTAAEESSQVKPEVVQPKPVLPPTSVNANSGRLQFKLPSGETKSHSFVASTTLSQVREFIDNNIVLPFSQYQLATTFPRREFTARDNSRDLRSLQLLPSAVILILPVYGSVSMTSSPGWVRVIMDMMWDLVQPVIHFSTYISNVLFRRGASSDASTSDRPNTTETTSAPPSSANQQSFTHRLGGRTTIKKRGNIYSLQDSRDDNDENNTWNGNSTEQM